MSVWSAGKYIQRGFFFLFSCIFFSCGYLKLCYFWGTVVLLWCRSSESAKIWRTRPRVKFFSSIRALSFMFAQIWSSVSATDKRTDFYVPLEFVIILYRSGWFPFRVIHYSVAYNVSFWSHNQPNSVVWRRNHKQPQTLMVIRIENCQNEITGYDCWAVFLKYKSFFFFFFLVRASLRS